MHVFSLIYPVIITKHVCKSQILKCFACVKILEKREFLYFLK